MDEVEGSQEADRQRQEVGLDEAARIVRLIDDIDADDLEPGQLVAAAGAAGAAESVKQLHGENLSSSSPQLAQPSRLWRANSSA